MLSIAAALAGPILKAVLAPLFAWLTTLYQNQQARQLGAAQAAAASAAQSAKVEQAVAQAEVDAPKTQAQAVDAFEAGAV